MTGNDVTGRDRASGGMSGGESIGVECLNDGAYVLGSLSPAERQTFERHLADCPRCQASVQRLAGLPGLLSLVGKETLAEPPALPPTLLPALLGRVHGARLRRRLVTGGAVVLAAACAAALVIALMLRPATAPATAPAVAQPPNAVLTMSSQTDSPMAVTVSLVDKQWGTSITVNCRYAQSHYSDVDYELVVLDRSRQRHNVGSWAAVSGNVSTVTTATSLHRADISGFEVQLPNGLVVLRAST